MVKARNNYVDGIPLQLYNRIPKAVWAALALSYASQGGENFNGVMDKIFDEWSKLYLNDVVPQKPARP